MLSLCDKTGFATKLRMLGPLIIDEGPSVSTTAGRATYAGLTLAKKWCILGEKWFLSNIFILPCVNLTDSLGGWGFLNLTQASQVCFSKRQLS